MSDLIEAGTALACVVAQLERARSLAVLRSRRAVECLPEFRFGLTPNARIDDFCLSLPLSHVEIGALLEPNKENVSRCFAELSDIGAVVAEGPPGAREEPGLARRDHAGRSGGRKQLAAGMMTARDLPEFYAFHSGKAREQADVRPYAGRWKP